MNGGHVQREAQWDVPAACLASNPRHNDFIFVTFRVANPWLVGTIFSAMELRKREQTGVGVVRRGKSVSTMGNAHNGWS